MKMLNKVLRTLQWIQDVENGGLIEATGYTGSYLDLGTISVNELYTVCTLVNCILILSEYKHRVCWIAGEIRPVKDETRRYYLDEEINGDILLYILIEVDIKKEAK